MNTKIVNQAFIGRASKVLCLLFFCFAFALPLIAQTSWKGTVSTSWSTASNWTNGIPTTAIDAVIGDANFTGNFQPVISSQASCKSLTVGAGTKISTLSIDKSFTVSGNLTIGANGSVSHFNNTITLKGNWTNSGSYSANHINSTVAMAGITQVISGITVFRKLSINAGSTTTLSNNITVAKSFSVNGVFDPGTFLVTLTGSSFGVGAGATLKVKASTFASNFSSNPVLNAESAVDYASSVINQTIAVLSYGTLRISGGLVKTLAGNITVLSSSAATGNVNILAGTLDLSTKTLNRGSSTAGGSFTIANGAILKIGGTTTFPANFASSNLATTSTVEYYGTNQTVSNQPYGNLTLSSSSGSATKTMPATALVIANDFTSSIGSGTSVSFTAGAAISINGNITIGASTTFNGGSFSHGIGGNWVNNGTFAASTSTITMSGTNKTIGGNSTTTFNNLSVIGLGVTSSVTNMTVAGNLSTSGAGTFVHSAGTLLMSGSSNSITGADITLNGLTVSGTINTTSSIIIGGSLLVTGSLNASAGTINMNGTGKTITNTGSLTFYGLRIVGTVSTSTSFSILSDMSGSGKLTATAGTITFIGTSTFGGVHDLYNVTLNGIKLQLGANATLGVANAFTISAGSFDVTTSIPNTVSFNGSSSQNIPSTTYDNLTTSMSGTKTATGVLTINNAITIGNSTTFVAGSYTHTVKGNWVNNGTFTQGTSTIQLTGDNDTSLIGVTTFNILTINKSNSSHYVTLNNNISVPTLNMMTGELRTGNYSVTITNTRSGNGIILGTITRTHVFSSLTAYAFESPYNTVTFETLLGSVSSVTVTVHSASVDDFPLDGSINRVYNYSITNTGTYVATVRMHYEDDELNGNSESSMMLWRYNSAWSNNGKSLNSSTNNWVENTMISDISGRWTISDNNEIAVWKGATSNAWETASNWKSGSVPTSSTIVQIGTEAFVNQPTISSTVSAKAMTFGSVQAATLTLSGGATLHVNGNVRGDWTANAGHTINVGGQTLTVTGDIVLSNGTTNRMINLNIGSGIVNVGGSLTQAGNSSIAFSGNGTLSIGESFEYSGGTFTSGTGTVVYNGTTSQTVGGAISYYNLSFNKSGGTATFSSPITVNGNLTLSTGGVFNLNANMTVAGNVTINNGVTVNESSQTLTVGGNWIKSGTFNSSLGTVTFNGTGSQTVESTIFYNMIVNKSGGTLSPLGNLTINSNVTVTAGTFDLGSYTVNRSVAGGTVTVSAGATLKLSGESNFPGNFNNKTLASTSTVEYNGTGAQNIAAVTFGNLTLSNGGNNAKVLTGSTTVGGNLTINNGSTLNESLYTLTLQGNLTNNGSFIPSTGTVVLEGASKSLSGALNLNNLIVTGSYTATAGSNLVIDGNVVLSGSYINGTNSISVAGDLNLSGLLSSDGVTTYTGTRLQTLRLTGTITSPSLAHTVIFAGTIAPVLNSTATPTFANVIISNTGAGGIISSVDWNVYGTFQVTSGATFNGGSLTHTFYGSQFNNEGTVLSSGTLYFKPVLPFTTGSCILKLGSGSTFSTDGTVNFGGTKQIVFDGTPSTFDNVIISNTNASGVTPVGNWTINEEFVVNEGAIFNGGAFDHTIKSDITISGTLNGGTSQFIITPIDSVYISGGGSIGFNHITMNGAVFALEDFSVSGNFIDNGSFYSNGSEIEFNGDSDAIIGGMVSFAPFETLIINKASTAMVTLNKGISELTSLIISGGTLHDNGLVISEEQTMGGSFAISSGARLKIDSTNTLPVFTNGYSFHSNSTVEYAGTTQSVAQQDYGNLTTRNSGVKTLPVGITQATTFTNSATLAMPEGSTLQLTGDWINNGVVNAANASTVKFSGSGIQNISGTAITNFKDIVVTNTSDPGVRVESKQNLLGVLTLSSNAVIDADGSSNTTVFTLVSTGDSPTADAAIGILPSGARVTGKVTVQRYMSIEGPNKTRIYRYISSPLQNATVADIKNEIPITGKFTGGSGAASLFEYNESVITDLNKDKVINMSDGYVQFPKSSTSEIFTPGRGYSMFVRGDLLTSALWDVRGTINVGNVTPVSLPVSYTSSGTPANDGWNLVGNPFPASIDWSATIGWTKTNIEETIYIRDNGNNPGRFAVWNGVIGINGGSRYLATGQAFWVKATGAGAPVLTANENVKASGNQTTFFRTSGTEITNLLRIIMVKGTSSDETAIHFREGATDQFDNNADARKLPGSSFNLSSRLADGMLLSINSMAPFNCTNTVKLSIDNVKAGSYRFDFSELNTFSTAIAITLKDKFANKTFDVRSGGSYTFSVTSNAASVGSNRFEIVFSAPAAKSDFALNAASICAGDNASIEISNSQSGAAYVGVQNDVVITESVFGTGNTINLIVPHSKLIVGQNTISVRPATESCSLGAQKDVTIGVEKKYEVTEVKNSSHCGEGSMMLIASGAPQNGTYNWYGPSSDLAIEGQHGETFVTASLTASETYFVAIVNSLGCEGTKVPVTATIVESIDAQITESRGVLISNYNQGNQWYFNNEILQGATTPQLEPKNSGVYRVEISINECSGSAEYEYIVTGMGEDDLNEHVSVFPNPTTDKIKVAIKNTEKGKVILMNGQGQVIRSESLMVENGDGACEFNMSELSNGVYIVRFMDNLKLKDVKVMKK